MIKELHQSCRIVTERMPSLKAFRAFGHFSVGHAGEVAEGVRKMIFMSLFRAFPFSSAPSKIRSKAA